MSTTPTGVAPAAAVATPENSSPATDQIDSFQSLWEAQNQVDTGEAPDDPNERPDLSNTGQEGEAEEPAETAPTAERPSKDATAEKSTDPAKPDDKHYDNLDTYIKDNGIEPESFMQLPVKVRVDGADQDVPLGEVVKAYQLSQASYARMNEAAQERQKISTEVTQVRGALGVQIKQANSLLQLAQSQLVQDFNGVDWNALRTSDPGNYSALYTDFQARQTAIQKAMKDVADAEQVNARAQEQQRAQAIPVERERLMQARPEWRDPAKAQAAHRAIADYGRKLGFTDAELNSITDHRQLLVLDAAARFAQLQAATPGTLKRVRIAPKMAAPGTRQVRDPKGSAVKNTSEAWKRSGYRNEEAAAAFFEQLG
jgi:hypothetical protein